MMGGTRKTQRKPRQSFSDLARAEVLAQITEYRKQHPGAQIGATITALKMPINLKTYYRWTAKAKAAAKSLDGQPLSDNNPAGTRLSELSFAMECLEIAMRLFKRHL